MFLLQSILSVSGPWALSNGPASRECGNRRLALRYVTHCLPPELGAIATALPEMLAAAFDSWESSG